MRAKLNKLKKRTSASTGALQLQKLLPGHPDSTATPTLHHSHTPRLPGADTARTFGDLEADGASQVSGSCLMVPRDTPRVGYPAARVHTRHPASRHSPLAKGEPRRRRAKRLRALCVCCVPARPPFPTPSPSTVCARAFPEFVLIRLAGVAGDLPRRAEAQDVAGLRPPFLAAQASSTTRTAPLASVLAPFLAGALFFPPPSSHVREI
jgi:hypothetical protein